MGWFIGIIGLIIGFVVGIAVWDTPFPYIWIFGAIGLLAPGIVTGAIAVFENKGQKKYATRQTTKSADGWIVFSHSFTQRIEFDINHESDIVKNIYHVLRKDGLLCIIETIDRRDWVLGMGYGNEAANLQNRSPSRPLEVKMKNFILTNDTLKIFDYIPCKWSFEINANNITYVTCGDNPASVLYIDDPGSSLTDPHMKKIISNPRISKGKGLYDALNALKNRKLV